MPESTPPATNSPRLHKAILVSLAVSLGITAVLPAALPSLRSRFSNIPCLAPIIREIDPNAPGDIEEAMVLPPYQAPRPLDKIGEVSFPITTENAQAQNWFNQGMALLHAFWYSEAERCFRQVVYLDPQCPMAFWGLALANEGRPKVAEIYLQRALYELSHRNDITPREKQWINLFLNYYDPNNAPLSNASDEDALARRATRIRALEDLAYENPDDVEARAFLLRHLTLDEHRAGVPITSHFTADTLAEQIYRLNPQHPSRHYRSFLWLNVNPARAVDTALENTRIAPGVPDMWRYSAQVFAAARDFANALPFGEAALRAAHSHMARDLIMPDDMENLIPNYAAHIETLSSIGKTARATETAHALIQLPRSAYLGPRTSFEQARQGSFFTGTRLLAETLMRHERWQQLLEACQSPLLEPGPGPAWIRRAHLHYWQAIASLNLDQPEQAAQSQQDLDELFRKFRSEGTTNDIKDEIARCIRSLRTYQALFTGALKEAPDFEREPLLHITTDHLARLLFKGGFKTEALLATETDLAHHPGHPLFTANYCDLQYRTGKKDAALLAFDSHFRRHAGLADSGLPLFQRLRPIADHLNFRSNWTLPPLSNPLADQLPDLSSLGPLPYSPPEAPAWTLPDHNGTPITLESYRDKPVLVIFFLGVGCVFCVEQLNLFSPHVNAFTEAGIPIVAISTDSQEILAQSLGDPSKPGFPFPVVADDQLEMFKAYRVHDDFEDKPMHGTFLIDPHGKILWSDIGHEPFMFPEFLLTESQRLLNVENTGDSDEQ